MREVWITVQDPEKLFENAVKDWESTGDSAKDHLININILEKFENILLLLGHGDYDDLEDKNPNVGADFDGGECFDNLTQKVYVWKADILLIQGLFKEGMLAFDKASQINPKNKHVYARTLTGGIWDEM